MPVNNTSTTARESNFPIDQESSATALVRCTGLAIICLNEEEKRGEIGFIRDLMHQLKIRILQPYYADGTNDDVRYREVVSYQSLPKENVQVEIRAHGARSADSQDYTNGNTFERLRSTDLKDFRWLVHMQELHGQRTLRPTSEQPYPLTKVHLYNGFFYTHNLDENRMFQKVKLFQGVKLGEEKFGRVGETLGAQINGKKVSLTIRVGDMVSNHSLPRIAGLPWRVELTNTARAGESDMPLYYKYITASNGEQFNLRQIRRRSNVMPSPIDFCHPVVFPFPSLDQL